jgi:hypothetical protein
LKSQIGLQVDVNKAWETIRENIKISVKKSLGYYELKKNKLLFDEGSSVILEKSNKPNYSGYRIQAK